MERLPAAFLKSARAAAGFTLIELLVVLGIITILTSIALSGQSQFNRTLALNNAAYDIALSLRQAQSLGLSSRTYGATGNAGYGISFMAGTPTSYTLFADTYPSENPDDPNCGSHPRPSCKPGDGMYDDSSELVQTYQLNNGFSLSNICAISSGSTACSSNGLTQLAVSFVRPDATTVILGKSGVWNRYTSACVTLKSPQGDERYVSISENSQVSLASGCPPSGGSGGNDEDQGGDEGSGGDSGDSTPAPTCTLSANPTSMPFGNSTTLTWSTTYADSFSINNGVNSVTPVAGGSVQAQPPTCGVPTTYTGTVTNSTGSATCSTAPVTRSCGGPS